DGPAVLLCDGVIRARCRDPQNGGAFTAERLSTIEPGQIYEYTIRFWRGTGQVFARGHRIRGEGASSYYPYYLRDLNTRGGNRRPGDRGHRGPAEDLPRSEAPVACRAPRDPRKGVGASSRRLGAYCNGKRPLCRRTGSLACPVPCGTGKAACPTAKRSLD